MGAAAEFGVQVPTIGPAAAAIASAWNSAPGSTQQLASSLANANSTVLGVNKGAGADAFAAFAGGESSGVTMLNTFGQSAQVIAKVAQASATLADKTAAAMDTFAAGRLKMIHALEKVAPVNPVIAMFIPKLRQNTKESLLKMEQACAANQTQIWSYARFDATAGGDLDSLLASLTAAPKEGDGKDNPNLKPEPLTEQEIKDINAALDKLRKNNDAATRAEVLGDLTQGQIGDCYLLAPLISILSSEEGVNRLLENIKPHYDENGKQDGYTVTLYKTDGFLGIGNGPQEHVVTDRYGGGVKQSGLVSLAAVIERAYGEQIGDKDLNDGGHSDAAAEAILNQNMTRIDKNGGGFLDPRSDHYSEQQRQQMIDQVSGGDPVVGSTASTDRGHFEHSEKNDDGKSYWSFPTVHMDGPNGPEEKIRLYGAHAYTVVGADSNGVTLQNPHGWNSTEQDQGTSATFYMTWEQYEYYFDTTYLRDK